MRRTAICNHFATCMFYKNWLATGDNRLNIIQIELMENRDYYTCVALNAVKMGLSAGGVPMISELAARIRPEDLQRLECPYLSSLNVDSKLISGQQRE
jgi:hypothetical protein